MKKLFRSTYAEWIFYKVFRQSLDCGNPVVHYTTVRNNLYFHGVRKISSASNAGVSATFSFPRAFHDVSNMDIQEENPQNIPCQANDNFNHTPVMVQEVLSVLDPKENQVRKINKSSVFYCV